MSTAIVLAVIAIILVAWLPGRTRDSMRRVVEHRQDRYSPSLHLVDERSGTRFSDERTPTVKGVLMQPTRTASPGPTRERIVEVRRRRREAIRRRRVLVSVLFGCGAAVLLAARIWAFTPWWSLVFFLPLLVVVALGVRASAHARRWENRVRTLRGEAGRTSAKTSVKSAGSRDTARIRGEDARTGAHSAGDDSPTATLAARQIRQALRRTAEERDRRTGSRHLGHGVPTSTAAPMTEVSAAVQASMPDSVPESTATSTEDADFLVTSSTPSPATGRPRPQSPATAGSGPTTPAPASDETNELVTVHPAVPLDAFDMAASSQDLISFSLGQTRAEASAAERDPQSLEIRSTRQVSRAIPPKSRIPSRDAVSGESRGADADGVEKTGVGVDDADDASAEEESESSYASAEDFHKAEMEASVEAPPVTDDSLGPAIESILSRRSA